MEPDEINAIATRLTAQWIRMQQRSVPLARANGATGEDTSLLGSIGQFFSFGNPSNATENKFFAEVRTYGERVLQYEDKELLNKALEHIPIHKLYEEAGDIVENDPDESLDDQVIVRLMHWFKHDFFTWINLPPCDYCGSEKVEGQGTGEPTEDDRKWGARIVELYRCLVCHNITRFPRYNDCRKLLETRRGRCGEWANCFTLCCRAVGTEARLIYDKTDHVWTEVYSEAKERWVHCDSGEEAWDQPLMYSEGWGKKLNYVIAFSAEEAFDVTKRYTRHWPDVLKRRTLVREEKLREFLDNITRERQKDLDEERKTLLRERRKREEKELEDTVNRKHVTEKELVGRKTGSLEWRRARGEDAGVIDRMLADYKHDKNLQLEGYHTLGTASVHSNSVLLTPADPDQLGGIYCKEPVDLQQTQALELEFAFRITNKQGGPAYDGADGFAFVIQASGPGVIGQGGCELGYGGIRNSIAIEFDTYKSADRCDDPSGNHISIHAVKPPNPNSAHQKNSLGYTSHVPQMNSGQWISARIRLFLSRGVIEVSLKENEQDEDYTPVLVKENLKLLEYFGSNTKAWVGFTASTGGLAQNHEIQWKYLATYTSITEKTQ